MSSGPRQQLPAMFRFRFGGYATDHERTPPPQSHYTVRFISLPATKMARASKNARNAETSAKSKREICEALEKTRRLQGCGCQNCIGALYDHTLLRDHRTPFHSMKGWLFDRNDAWHLAEGAVTWIEATTNVNPDRLDSIDNWWRWNIVHSQNSFGRPFKARIHETLGAEELAEVVDIFSELFFCGQLPASRVTIQWGVLGHNTRGQAETQRAVEHVRPGVSRILLNKDYNLTPMTRNSWLGVVLHEMIHAYLRLYTCWPWSKLNCAKGACGKLWMANYGRSGHGRAFHFIAKAVERKTHLILGFTADLGRRNGSNTEFLKGGPRPCERDAKELYPWMLQDSKFSKCQDEDDHDYLSDRRGSGKVRGSYMGIPQQILARTQTGKRRYSC